jgi:Tol biopolymer transport system component
LVSVAIDMSGQTTQLDAQGLAAMRVSPDGSRVLGYMGKYWWIYPLNGREAPRKLFEADSPADANLIWTPDGQHIAFRSRTKAGIFWQSANGGASEELLLAVDGVPIQWSRDGTTLFYLFDRKLWSWSRAGRPRVIAPMDAPYVSVSPDHRWVAYHVTEHGTAMPYIQSLVNPTERFQITQNGGHAPLWSADGRKLFYVSGPTNSLMAVDVRTAPAVAFGQPVMLARRIFHGLALGERWFDATPDGTKVLAQIPDGKDPQSWQFEVVLNWFNELKRNVPTP